MTLTNYPTEGLIAARQTKDESFKLPDSSPLTARQQLAFDGLRYYPANPALAFDLTPIVFSEDEQTLQRIMTSANEIRHYRRWGRLEFAIDGQTFGLTLYKDEGGDDFFLPFTDSTNGGETYSAGRYVEVELLPGGKLRLDFNQAYNPYCAYGPGWSCPIVPAENRLGVPIRAGEQMPSEAWAEHS